MNMMLVIMIVVLLAGVGIVIYALMNSDKDGDATQPVKPADVEQQFKPDLKEPVKPASVAAAAEPLGPALLSDGPSSQPLIEQFSYKEVISHGWDMARKYWQPLLIVAIIYFCFQGLSGVLEFGAGRAKLTRPAVNVVYKDRATGDFFYQFLIDGGYISKSGDVLPKLKDIKAISNIPLPANFTDKTKQINQFLDAYRYRLPFPKPVYYFLSIVLWLINMVLMVGFTKVSIMAARDETPSPAELYLNWKRVVPYFLASICYGLAVIGGFILLIVPGIIVMVICQMYVYLVVDKGLGPIAALKRSRVITKGYRMRIFILGFLLMLLNLAGFLCLVIGFYFTVWTSCIAMAAIYDRLEQAHS